MSATEAKIGLAWGVRAKLMNSPWPKRLGRFLLQPHRRRRVQWNMTISARSRAAAMMLLFMATALVPALAQDDPAKRELPAALHVEQLLAGPDHQDIDCDLKLSPASLTFQQRYLVRLQAEVDPGAEDRRNELNLFFVVRIADANGTWLPERTYQTFQIPAGFDKDSAIQYSTGFYARPGKYTAALIVYDAKSGKTDVIRKPFEVTRPKSDPLPQLDRDLPTIDFISDVPVDEPTVRAQDRYGRRLRPRPEPSYHAQDEWAPGHGVEYLPVRNSRPMLVDIILNVASPSNSLWDGRPSGTLYRSATGIVLQAGSILSHVGVERGCVRVSAIDVSKLQVIFDPMHAHDMDWDKIAKEVNDQNKDTISLAALTHRKDEGDFLAKYLQKIAEDRAGCEGQGGPVEHAVVFVSRDFSFPSGTHNKHLDTKDENVRYFEVRLRRYGSGDDLAGFFKTAKAEKFDADSPEQFRAALAKLIAALGGGGADGN